MPHGYLALVLHAHLPFVKHPEYNDAFEEDWLFEALTETYLPLLDIFERVVSSNISFKLTMTISPSLMEMFADPYLQEKYLKRLDKLQELSEKELRRTKDTPFYDTALMYADHFKQCRHLFSEVYRGNVLEGFRRFANAGFLDIITCGATHGFFPLMAVEHDRCVRAQVRVGAANYRKHMGRSPNGIWLPECAYYPGDDRHLKDAGLRYFLVDTHGLMHAAPRPCYGVFAPVYTTHGVAAFGRDLESSKQVWSSKEGYPGDSSYMEFYRDIGYDLDYEYIKPYIHESGIRKNIGIKYHKITGPTDHKEPYIPARAKETAAAHAGNFMFNRQKQLGHLSDLFKKSKINIAPVVVAPYDAELFGHWWFEGPQFLDFLFRKIHCDQNEVELITLGEYLSKFPRLQMVSLGMSSWGYKGYNEVWLNESNDWIYRHLHHGAKVMANLADEYVDVTQLERRALNQALRELLLAQSSDWAFIMKTGTVVEYARTRTETHLTNLLKLDKQIRDKYIDEGWLSMLEFSNSIFQEIQYEVFRYE